MFNENIKNVGELSEEQLRTVSGGLYINPIVGILIILLSPPAPKQ